ncbi:MAG: hypothetical protein IKC46_00095 [Lachnospiraceae bacterium]|nr:hypothetical protein [Lachnospiraceae bacterium]
MMKYVYPAVFTLEPNGQYPSPSPIHAIAAADNEFINYIACDTLEYAKRSSKKAVTKTLTIPEWLDFEATRQNINFSQLLQEAIKAKLNI